MLVLLTTVPSRWNLLMIERSKLATNFAVTLKSGERPPQGAPSHTLSQSSDTNSQRQQTGFGGRPKSMSAVTSINPSRCTLPEVLQPRGGNGAGKLTPTSFQLVSTGPKTSLAVGRKFPPAAPCFGLVILYLYGPLLGWVISSPLLSLSVLLLFFFCLL